VQNYCMQVQSDQCGAHEEGNCVSFDDVEAATRPTGVEFRAGVLPRVHALVCDAALAARRELLLGLREHGNGRAVCALLGKRELHRSSAHLFHAGVQLMTSSLKSPIAPRLRCLPRLAQGTTLW
jgi:hypothetical protein